jgi:hypothetical protein
MTISFIVLMPFLFKDPDEFERIYEPLDVKSKKIHVVDSGLTFNLPYPLILRPQRGVDLIISFDFSARPSDTSPPFKVRRTMPRVHPTVGWVPVMVCICLAQVVALLGGMVLLE